MRAFSGFHSDDRSDFIAEISCSHHRHVRRRSSIEVRPWVLDPESGRSRVENARSCPLCD
jgi:hypothetical protein